MYLLNILGQGQRRAVLLTATGSDSKSDLLSPQLFEKMLKDAVLLSAQCWSFPRSLIG